MSLYNSADSHGWVTHIFKVIAHMLNVVCFSFIHLANNYSLQVCGVTKIRARRKCWRKPPNQKETRDWQIFNCSPNAKQLYNWAHEKKKKKNMRTFLYCRSSTFRDETGISFRPKMTVQQQPKNPRVCVRWRFHVCYFGQVRRKKELYFLSLSLCIDTHTTGFHHHHPRWLRTCDHHQPEDWSRVDSRLVFQSTAVHRRDRTLPKTPSASVRDFALPLSSSQVSPLNPKRWF